MANVLMECSKCWENSCMAGCKCSFGVPTMQHDLSSLAEALFCPFKGSADWYLVEVSGKKLETPVRAKNATSVWWES